MAALTVMVPNAEIITEMIYQIYKDKDLIVETDSMDFVKSVVRRHTDCLVKELLTGRVYKPKVVKKAATPSLASAAAS